MADSDGARNQFAEKENDVYHYHIGFTSHGCRRNADDNFTYLGSVISKDESAQKGIKNRLSKARKYMLLVRDFSLYIVWQKLTKTL